MEVLNVKICFNNLKGPIRSLSHASFVDLHSRVLPNFTFIYLFERQIEYETELHLLVHCCMTVKPGLGQAIAGSQEHLPGLP